MSDLNAIVTSKNVSDLNAIVDEAVQIKRQLVIIDTAIYYRVPCWKFTIQGTIILIIFAM